MPLTIKKSEDTPAEDKQKKTESKLQIKKGGK